jgi:hypothetical protein
VNSLYIDLGAVLLILANVALGWRFGIVGRAIALGGLYGGVAAATFLGNGLLRFFGGGGAANDLYTSAWTYVGIVLGVVAMVEILGAVYRERVEKLISLMFDRTAGIAGGVVVGVFEVAIITMVALAVGDAHASTSAQQIPADHSNPASAVRNSLIGSHVAGLDPAMRTIFGPALPDSLSNHLADTTAVASK